MPDSSETSLLSRNSSKASSTSSKASKSSSKCGSFTAVKVDKDGHKCSQACVDRYPIHHAARLGNFNKLRELLDDPLCSRCPFEADECLQRTPLHYACAAGNVEKGLVCVKLLLDSRHIRESSNPAEKLKSFVNHLDKLGKTALHLAAKNEATSVVIELLTHQADFDITSNDGTCALREIYKNTPDAMEEALNQSISYVENCSRPNRPSDNISEGYDEYDFTSTCLNVCLDFYPVIGSKLNVEECRIYAKKCDNNAYIPRSPESGFLFSINRKRMDAKVRRQILTNALVKSFLYFKWQKVKWFCITAIAFHALWLSLYITTVISVFVSNCPFVTLESDSDLVLEKEDKSTKEYSTVSTESLFIFSRSLTPCTVPVWMQMGSAVLLILSCVVSVKELFQLFRLKSMYFRFENLGQCLLLSFIFLTVPEIYLRGQGGYQISSLDYQISAFGIFLAWTLLLCQLAKLPRIIIRFRMFGVGGMLVFPDHGIYVEILTKVFKNFLIFISIFSSLLISFVFSFSILLPNSTGFGTLPSSLLKVLTMMAGELNYDDIFHGDDTKLVYPVSSHLMYAIFIMVATIILFNLLIGFTVSDIQGLQKDAEINQISNKLEQIFLMECFLLSRSLQKGVYLFGKLFRVCNVLQVFDGIMVAKNSGSLMLCYHTTIKALPTLLRIKVRNHASKNCLAISDICGVARSKLFSKTFEQHRNFEH